MEGCRGGPMPQPVVEIRAMDILPESQVQDKIEGHSVGDPRGQDVHEPDHQDSALSDNEPQEAPFLILKMTRCC